jgi:Protein of unknown function (DUF2721)
MELTLATPTLLFPATSLVLLAYTNRFLHLSALVRKLHSDWVAGHDPGIFAQVKNLRQRITLIRCCQAFGVISMLISMTVMLMLITIESHITIYIFAISVTSMALSLLLSLWEILISGKALNIYLNEMQENN